MSDAALQKKPSAWPQAQKLEKTAEPSIVLAHFEDWEDYHAGLIAKLLCMREGSVHYDGRFPGGCGEKLRDIAAWGIEAADLLNARACELFKRVTGHPTAVVDESWASIYAAGDYCMPHSHTRATGSVVYLLDPGDEVVDDPLSGKLCFADPRMACCCQVAPGYMTNLMIPPMRAGSMIVFPASAVHTVGLYRGARPRITLSWNIAPAAIPGKPKRLRVN